MFKKYSFFIYCLFISLLVYQYSGCDSDTINQIINPPGVSDEFDSNEAGAMMTLAALCYTAEGSTNALHIRDSINLQLDDSNYATGGNWEVCWGPGLSPSGGNLMYVAMDSTGSGDTIFYAICVRGTILSLANIEEDLDVIYLTPWTYGMAGDSIAYGSAEGFDTLLNTFDPITNQSLIAFLNSLNNPKQKLYVTGHSLGGAMATLMTAWLVESGITSRFKVESYTFAAPTVGNTSFANNFNSRMVSFGVENHRCVNTKDIVPYAWADLNTIISQNIPTTVPPLITAIIQTAANYLRDSGIVYKHVNTRVSLGTKDPIGCGSIGEDSTYICWVEFEHSSRTYLELIGVDTINWGRPRLPKVMNERKIR